MNRIYRVVIGLVAVTALIGSSAQTNDSALRDRAIGYVMTDLFWSVYQTPDAKQECPRGFNDGPREQFEQLYPYHEGLTVEETQLKQEIETWHPSTEPDGFEFLEVEGEISWGLNLDGEVGPNDFVHPDGSPGIDNEVYRAVGCVIGFRGPDGVEFIFQNKAIVDERYNRMMVELTEVDDLDQRLALGEADQDVGRLEVAMDDALLMGVGDGGTDLDEELDALGDAHTHPGILAGSESVEIGIDDRQQRPVQNRRREPFIFAEFGVNFRRRQDVDAVGHNLTQDFHRPRLVLRIGVGMQEADGHTVDILGRQSATDFADAVLVE